MNRGSQPQSTSSAPATAGVTHTPQRVEKPSRRGGDNGGKWYRISLVILLFCITVLAVGVIGTLWFGNSSQTKYINDKKYQAVFLTNGQVYFGHIKTIGDDFINLQNIYYLQAATTTDKSGNTTQTGNYSLVQLGCQQIHDPYNQMVINRDQVSFWENLQDNGQVVKKINEFIKQYPNGPDCTQTSTQTQASSNTNTQNGTNPTANKP